MHPQSPGLAIRPCVKILGLWFWMSDVRWEEPICPLTAAGYLGQILVTWRGADFDLERCKQSVKLRANMQDVCGCGCGCVCVYVCVCVCEGVFFICRTGSLERTNQRGGPWNLSF